LVILTVIRMFAPTRTLLNPKFECYKLDIISQEDAVTRYPLEYKATQATVSGRSTFSFQEIQSRITHNHLAVCSEAGRAIYVDSNARVIAIDVDAVRNLLPSLSCFPLSLLSSRKQSTRPLEFCMNCQFPYGQVLSKHPIASILLLFFSRHP
jgi:hypothetical protein